MARLSQDDLRNLDDFATTFRWNLSIVKLPSGISTDTSSADLNLRCETSEIPKLTLNSIETRIRGHKVKSPGVADYAGALTFTFVETENNKIHNFIKAWRELVWETQSGKTLPKSELEATLRLARLDSQDNEIYEYVLVGCYYEDADFGSLDNEGGDFMKPSLTVSYDYFKDKSV